MKNSLLTLLTAVSLVSCASGPNAQTGAVLGGLGGAAVGGIIGNQSGRGLEGALIGGGIGALGGNAIGNSRDQRNQQQYYQGQQQRGRQQGYYDRNGNYHYY
ncbi:YMGG-like glycine zipper-containing protein [Prosthecobacter sp.]|uniref:YMGG-like glycine zipper-containing protein n=1 Tax=Prosthecobacter sp. TaxID=1965333 RepID=UPI002487EC48|nr:YMGG-like glycine zipper-containing protein [Prosthecobacter sp.]MDI1313198.1 glycine zipper domain-containing protein [Prosthecobacter sp.]